MAQKKGAEDRVELESLRSPGFFHSAIQTDGRLNVPDRFEVLQDRDRDQFKLAPVPRNSAGEVVPFPLWRNAKANEIVCASDVEQFASYQITAYVTAGGSVEIPMVDAAGFPLVSPSLPPLTCLRFRPELTSTDRVNDPGASGITWVDRFVCLDWDGAPEDSRMIQDSFATFRWRRENEPRAHWVLELYHVFPDPAGTGTVTHANLLAHVLGEFGGQAGWPGTSGIPSRDIEFGSSGTPGHWHLRPIPPSPVYDHLGNQDQSRIKSHCWGYGETYLQAGFNRIVYLQPPNALSTDSPIFQIPSTNKLVPAVLAYADRDRVQNRGLVPNTWLCGTWGRGHDYWGGIANPPVHNQADDHSFYTSLWWDGTAAGWAVTVFNKGTTSPGDDRQYYLFAWGRSYIS